MPVLPASGAFYHETASAQFAALLRLQDHLPRRAVLHRLAGVHKFGFAENGAAGCVGGAPEFDQGRVADDVDDVFVYLHEESPVEHTHEAYLQRGWPDNLRPHLNCAEATGDACRERAIASDRQSPDPFKTNYRLVFNFKTARPLGLKTLPMLVARAEEVEEVME